MIITKTIENVIVDIIQTHTYAQEIEDNLKEERNIFVWDNYRDSNNMW